MEATIYADRELTMTMQEFIDANAFYPSSRRQIKKLFAGREALSAIDVLELDIPDAHKLRAVLCEKLIPERTLHLLAVEFARAALVYEREAGREPDERCWKALDVKLAWLDGKASSKELEAAKAAADAAAKAAADAADDAAMAAAGTAWTARTAWDAYWAAQAAALAAWTASTAAYWAADAAADAAAPEASLAAYCSDRAAARDNVRAEQVALVRRMLGLAI